jgi:hypothetical protein
MPWAGWCTAADVRLRVKQATVAAAWTDLLIQDRIDRAQRTLTGQFVGLFGYTTISGWLTSCPPVMVDVCADQAALYVLTDWHGEAQRAEGKPGARLQERVDLAIAAILEGKVTLLDSAGAAVPTVCDRVDSTTIKREPVFTTRRRVQDRHRGEDGSLDDY